MTTKQWIRSLITTKKKKALPVLSFPSVSLLDITVSELISSPELQAKGMKAVADRVPSAASVSMMDLSVEAEAFGSSIVVSDSEVPTVTGALLSCEDDADTLAVPAVGAGRTGLYVEAIREACKLITDRPVFSGVIGPFSLSGRLMDVTEIMVNCYAEPDFVHKTMAKSTEFIIAYAAAFKAAGANGVVIAEPLTGLLSPDLADEFSMPYLRKIVEALQDENFVIIYHNCGNNTPLMLDSIAALGCDGYHFGNAIDMRVVLKGLPADVLVMGNIDPSSQFRNGTPESLRAVTQELMRDVCAAHPNFVISSGCDIPPASPWENIDAFFEAVADFYG